MAVWRKTERSEHSQKSNFTDETAPETVPPAMRIASEWSWRILLVAALLAVVIYLVVTLRLIVIPVLIAVLLGALLVPFANWLGKHRTPRWLSILIPMLSLLVVLSGLLTLGISQIVRGAAELAAQSKLYFHDFEHWLQTGPLQFTSAQLDSFSTNFLGYLETDTSRILGQVISFGTLASHILAGALLVLFATLFILIDGRGIWRWIVGVFPRRARAAIDQAGQAGWTTLQSFVKVQILVATIDAVGIGFGAVILGVPLAIPIAILVFLGSFIPIVGAVATGALAVFVALIYNGPVVALVMLLIVLAVQQIEGHVLQPLIMGAAVKVHPLAVVLAVATGSFLAGIPGALFAVPTVAVINVMMNVFFSNSWRNAPPVASTANELLWHTVPAKPGLVGSGSGSGSGVRVGEPVMATKFQNPKNRKSERR